MTWMVGMGPQKVGILAICSVASGDSENEYSQEIVLDVADDSIVADAVTP